MANVVITSGKTPKGKAIATLSPFKIHCFHQSQIYCLLRVFETHCSNRIVNQNDVHCVGQSGGLDMQMDISPRGVKLKLKDNIRAHIFHPCQVLAQR